MKLVANQVFHVYNRGNQQQKIFFRRENYLYFLQKIRYHVVPLCDVLAYCLMPNHFHLLIKTNEHTVQQAHHANPTIQNTAFSKELGKMLSSYTRALQKQEQFTGSLFQQKTKAKQVSGLEGPEETYVLKCLQYILYNPVKAGFVKSPQDWEYSNCRDLLGFRRGGLCNIPLLCAELTTEHTDLEELFQAYELSREAQYLF